MPQDSENLEVFDPDGENSGDLAIKEYDIVSSPNDFNVLSYYSFIDSGAIAIPGFQRHYVWDIRKASKLIESILMGLPIPQIFLYEDAKNKFLVIDGQQRLMTLYYFIKGRLPKRDARSKIRSIFAQKGKLEAADLDDTELFSMFKISASQDGIEGPYEGKTYATLGELQPTFNLRTIRNIMVKQVRPDDDRSSIFELFNRLNTGGVNLSQQEIRSSLFYGPIMNCASKCNEDRNWRKILGGEPDQRQKDVEIILRMLALANGHEGFKKPLTKFINDFCKLTKNDTPLADSIAATFSKFAQSVSVIERDLYLEPKSKRVSVPILESLFVASSENAVRNKNPNLYVPIPTTAASRLRSHADFESFFTGKTTDVESVKGRIKTAKGVMV